MTAHTLAWIAYILGALSLLLVGWRITLRLKREWRHLLMVTAGALLLTPSPIGLEEGTFLAPALFVLVLDGLFEAADVASQAGLILLGVWLAALVISLIYQLLSRR